MSGSRPEFYWEPSVIIGWLVEDFDGDDMKGIREVGALVDEGKVVVDTSVITRTEVLKGKLTEKAQEKFERFLLRSNVNEIAVDPRVADMSRQLRDHYQARKDAGKTKRILCGMDAIHLASAIHYGVDEFHTFDDGGKSARCLGLLPLSGDVAGHRLTIRKPRGEQRRLGNL